MTKEIIINLPESGETQISVQESTIVLIKTSVVPESDPRRFYYIDSYGVLNDLKPNFDPTQWREVHEEAFGGKHSVIILDCSSEITTLDQAQEIATEIRSLRHN